MFEWHLRLVVELASRVLDTTWVACGLQLDVGERSRLRGVTKRAP
jgi:hypothetical protein